MSKLPPCESRPCPRVCRIRSTRLIGGYGTLTCNTLRAAARVLPLFKLSSCLGVAQVCYYRYLRFLPGGQFLYRTSPQPLREVARSLLRPPPARGRAAEEFTQRGRFLLRVRAMGLPTRMEAGWVAIASAGAAERASAAPRTSCAARPLNVSASFALCAKGAWRLSPCLRG